MKFRKDFVTNSSSSSYVCEICGRSECGMDMSLSDAEMVCCTNGHTICEDEILMVPRDALIREIEDYQKKYPTYCDEIYTEDELKAMDDKELLAKYFTLDDARWSMPEECCPICQFIEYSQGDLAKYLEKKYKVSREEVFEKVKQLNKRRKKLYDSEYVTEACNRFNLNPTEIVAGLKAEFGSYRRFKDYIRMR